MAAAQARFAPGVDLALRAHKLPEGLGVFVVHDIAVGRTEKALFWFDLLG